MVLKGLFLRIIKSQDCVVKESETVVEFSLESFGKTLDSPKLEHT